MAAGDRPDPEPTTNPATSPVAAGEARRPDSLGMRDAALRAPELVTGAAALARERLTGAVGGAGLSREHVDAVLVLGAGEGEVAARLLAGLTSAVLPVPLVRSAGCTAPGFVAEGTLVLALSWAGGHAETVEACSGLPAGVPLVAITAGGGLARAAEERGGTIVPLPEGLPAGRAATSSLLAAALVVLEGAGLLLGVGGPLADATTQLAKRRDEVAAAPDPFGAFGRMGRRLAGTIPVVHGAGPLGGAAAASWAARVRLDTKGPAWWSTMPGLAHDELAAWGQHGDITRQLVSLVQLRHDHEHPSLVARFATADELLGEVVAGIHELHAAGDGPVAQALDLVLQGDLVALAMAAEAGLDPGPVGVPST